MASLTRYCSLRKFYNHFEYSDIYTLLYSDFRSEWLPERYGVHQGCILSPVIFPTVIDWIMCKTTADKHWGNQWTLPNLLGHLDFSTIRKKNQTDWLQSQHKSLFITHWTHRLCWVVVSNQMWLNKVSPFHRGCLWKIEREICSGPNKFSNKEVHIKRGCRNTNRADP